MARFVAGKKSKISADGTLLTQSEWSVTYSGDRLPNENFESNGKREGMIGFEGCAYSFKGGFDLDQNPFDDPPGIYPRDDLPNTKLYQHRDEAFHWNFPVSLVLDATNSSTATGRVEFEASCESNGDFSTP